MGFSIKKDELEKIEIRLGRSLASEKGRILNYQAIGNSEFGDLNLLARGGTIDAVNYLLYLLDGKGGLLNASSYISLVVRQGMQKDDWINKFYKAV